MTGRNPPRSTYFGPAHTTWVLSQSPVAATRPHFSRGGSRDFTTIAWWICRVVCLSTKGGSIWCLACLKGSPFFAMPVTTLPTGIFPTGLCLSRSTDTRWRDRCCHSSTSVGTTRSTGQIVAPSSRFFQAEKLPAGTQHLLFAYREELLAAGYLACKTWPYAFDTFRNGVRIPDLGRPIHHEAPELLASLDDPFSDEGFQAFVEQWNKPGTRRWWRRQRDFPSGVPDLSHQNRCAIRHAGHFRRPLQAVS